MTGPTSTPPMGGIIFLVIFKIELVGKETSIQNPLFKSTFGYQVKINLIKKTSVRKDNIIPREKSSMGR